CMRTVSVEVPWRGKLPWMDFFQTGVAAPCRIEVLRADQLLIAHGRVEMLAWNAFAVPARRNLPIAEFAILRWVAVMVSAIGETQALRPDAGVYDPDDDVFSSRAHASHLIP